MNDFQIPENQTPEYNAEIISVSTNKGGVLKTTTTVNLGGRLSLKNHVTQTWRKNRVLLVDIDAQGNVVLTFGRNPDKFEQTIYDVMVDGLPADKAIINVAPNIDVLPANDDMAFFELDVLLNSSSGELVSSLKPVVEIMKSTIQELKSLMSKAQEDQLPEYELALLKIKEKVEKYTNQLFKLISTDDNKFHDFYSLLKNALEPLRSQYDFIIIDTPPQLGVIAANVFMAAQDILIPFHPEKYSFRSMIKTINTINSWKGKNPDLKIKAIIPVKVKEQTLTHSVFLDNSNQIISSSENQIDITETVIPESIRPAEAVAKYNLPITLIDPEILKTKKLREQVVPLQETFNQLFEELGY